MGKQIHVQNGYCVPIESLLQPSLALPDGISSHPCTALGPVLENPWENPTGSKIRGVGGVDKHRGWSFFAPEV